MVVGVCERLRLRRFDAFLLLRCARAQRLPEEGESEKVTGRVARWYYFITRASRKASCRGRRLPFGIHYSI